MINDRMLIIRYNNKLNGSILYKCSDGIIPKEIEETKLLFIIRYHQIAACIYLIRLHIITLLYLMDILINICKSRMI